MVSNELTLTSRNISLYLFKHSLVLAKIGHNITIGLLFSLMFLSRCFKLLLYQKAYYFTASLLNVGKQYWIVIQNLIKWRKIHLFFFKALTGSSMLSASLKRPNSSYWSNLSRRSGFSFIPLRRENIFLSVRSIVFSGSLPSWFLTHSVTSLKFSTSGSRETYFLFLAYQNFSSIWVIKYI